MFQTIIVVLNDNLKWLLLDLGLFDYLVDVGNYIGFENGHLLEEIIQRWDIGLDLFEDGAVI